MNEYYNNTVFNMWKNNSKCHIPINCWTICDLLNILIKISRHSKNNSDEVRKDNNHNILVFCKQTEKLSNKRSFFVRF